MYSKSRLLVMNMCPGACVIANSGLDAITAACGVTPQAVVMHSKPEFCITHAPGHMFVTDVKNTALKF